QAVLFEGRLDFEGIGVAAANSPGLERQPAVMSQFFVFFEDEIAVLSGVKIPHRRICFLYTLEKRENRFPARGQLHFCVEVYVGIEFVREGTVSVHMTYLSVKERSGI